MGHQRAVSMYDLWQISENPHQQVHGSMPGALPRKLRKTASSDHLPNWKETDNLSN